MHYKASMLFCPVFFFLSFPFSKRLRSFSFLHLFFISSPLFSLVSFLFHSSMHRNFNVLYIISASRSTQYNGSAEVHMPLHCPRIPLWHFWPLQQRSDRTTVNKSLYCMAGSLKKGLNADLRGELGQVLSFNPAEFTNTLLLSPVLSLSQLSEFDIPHVVRCVDFGQ